MLSNPNDHQSQAKESTPVPLSLLLGNEWITEVNGGLNRYLSDLLGALEEVPANVNALVIGPANRSGVIPAGNRDQPLPLRILQFNLAARRVARSADVVDAHFALYAFWPCVYGKLKGVPLVVHFQGPWAQESKIANLESMVVTKIKRSIEKQTYSKAAQIVVLTGAFRRILVENYGIDPWRIKVIPPGVDLEVFGPGDRQNSRDHFKLLKTDLVAVVVRRMVARMGIDTLLRAWPRVLSTSPGAILLLVGDGLQRKALEKLAGDLEIAGSVKFLGRVDDARLVHCYRAADVAVVPSHALEGFGLVVLEALACGTPVVATDAGGLPEALAPLDPGLLVAAGDEEQLGKRIANLFDGTKPGPSSAKCREYAEKFNWADVAIKNIEVYRQAISPSSKGRRRVVFLDHCAQLSGAELALARLLPALTATEAHVILAEDGPLVDKLVLEGISVEVLPMAERARGLRRDHVSLKSFPPIAAFHSLAYVLRLARRLSHLKPDLVHCNSLKSGLYGTIASRLVGIPAIWHVHDRISTDYLPRPAMHMVRILSRFLPAAIIANSNATLSSLGPRGDQTCAVIASAAAESPTQRPPSTTTSPGQRTDLRVGMLGRLSPWKGQHVFLDAFALAFPEGGPRAVIIGSAMFGEDEYVRRLQDQAAKLGVDVEMKGFQEDVAGELASLDVLVHASVIPEPFGQVVIEGMAAGLPVVAADSGGPAEIITDGQDGVLYPMGDVGALSRVLKSLAEQPALRIRLGEAAALRASDYSPEIIAGKVLDLYRTIVPGP